MVNYSSMDWCMNMLIEFLYYLKPSSRIHHTGYIKKGIKAPKDIRMTLSFGSIMNMMYLSGFQERFTNIKKISS